MKWENNRKLSYLYKEFDDINLPHQVIYDSPEDLIQRIIHFFYTESELIYPAKSYFVAIIYAKALEKYFHEDFYKMLDYENLLPDDEYFIPYRKNPYVYDGVLIKIRDPLYYPSTKKTMKYFKEEMLI